MSNANRSPPKPIQKLDNDIQLIIVRRFVAHDKATTTSFHVDVILNGQDVAVAFSVNEEKVDLSFGHCARDAVYPEVWVTSRLAGDACFTPTSEWTVRGLVFLDLRGAWLASSFS